MARLRRAVPETRDFDMGAYVYFRRVQKRAGETNVKAYRRFGIARVIGKEKIPNTKLENRDLNPTAHAKHAHGVWLRYKTGTILASPE